MISPLHSDLAYLDDKREEMTEILRDWCAINSGSRNLEGLGKMRSRICDAFSSVADEIETVAADPHQVVDDAGDVQEVQVGDMVRIVHNAQAPVRVLLSGHMDTVFPVDHAFQSDTYLDDDTLNAPGGADMKGGLLVMLYALKTIARSKWADQIGYEVLINADEEIGSHGSARAIHAAAERAQFACVYEPALADGTLAGARKGSGNFTAVFKGKSAHAGREHHLGRNAIVAAADFAVSISKLTGGRENLTVNVGKIDGGGPVNVVPGLAMTAFNVRIEQPGDADWLYENAQERLNDIARDHDVAGELVGGFTRPPKPMTPQLQKFFEALRSVGAEIGIGVIWKPTGGCCDGNNIAAAGIPVIDTLGVRGGSIHSADEYVRLDSLVERAKLSALLLLKIASGELPNPGTVGVGK